MSMITVYGTKVSRLEFQRTGPGSIEECVDSFLKKHPLYDIEYVKVDGVDKVYVGRCEVSNKVILEGDDYVTDENDVKILRKYCNPDDLVDLPTAQSKEDITEMLAHLDSQRQALWKQQSDYLEEHSLAYAPVSIGQKISHKPTPHSDPGTVEVLSIQCESWPNRWYLNVRILDVPGYIGKTTNILITTDGRDWKPL